jgi:hypothetical protein
MGTMSKSIRLLHLLLKSLVGVGILCSTLWAVLAIRFSSLPPWAALPLAVAYPLIAIGLLWRLRQFWKWTGAYAGLFLIVLVGWLLMSPSLHRNWQPDVAEMPHADINGRSVTLHNVRNSLYRTEEDYTVRYETRTYDLDKLQSMDLFLVDWGLGKIAHTMFSFGFSDGQYICFSVETRKEVGESYSALLGFFRQYELIYIAGDERDLVGLRTNFRKGETVRLYRLHPKQPDRMELFFMDYMNRINDLYTRPQWYNALTDNCMTSAYRCMRKDILNARLSWKMVCNGYFDELAYERGGIYTGIPFEELKRESVINDRAQNAGDGENFSEKIRQGLPGIAQQDPSPTSGGPDIGTPKGRNEK